MRLRPFALITAVIASAVLVRPAAADCEPAGPVHVELPEADVAFVGTVTALKGSRPTFTVHEVWAGEVGPVVTIQGMAAGIGRGADPTEIIEDDRQWVLGARYLVLPVQHQGRLVDNACTATTPWEPGLERLRPVDAVVPQAAENPEEANGVTSIWPALVVAALGLILIGSLVAFRRR